MFSSLKWSRIIPLWNVRIFLDICEFWSNCLVCDNYWFVLRHDRVRLLISCWWNLDLTHMLCADFVRNLRTLINWVQCATFVNLSLPSNLFNDFILLVVTNCRRYGLRIGSAFVRFNWIFQCSTLLFGFLRLSFLMWNCIGWILFVGISSLC